MADEILKEDDDDIKVIEVDELPAPGEAPKVKADAEEGDDKAKDDEVDGDDEEDTRLAAQDEEDEDADAGGDSAARKKRVKRRQIQKQARDRTIAELTHLRQIVEDQGRQLAEVRGANLNTSEAQIDTRLSEVRRDIDTADRILAKAIEAGNGEDAAAALRLRDDAKGAELELTRAKGTFAEARKPAPVADPMVTLYVNQWKTQNAGWYGVDPAATQAANEIDTQVARDGYQPNTPAYYQELTRRVKQRFGVDDADEGDAGAGKTPPKKKAPPQGGTREHAPTSTRTEVYVTPDRKAAMVSAGVWDDPKERAEYLKEYAKYDREQSANR